LTLRIKPNQCQRITIQIQQATTSRHIHLEKQTRFVWFTQENRGIDLGDLFMFLYV